MKRLSALLIFICALLPARAEKLGFDYSLDADIVSNYIWRGFYEGGLSFQPELLIGWESEHTSFEFGTWWSVGATDWGFRSGLPIDEGGYNPNTYLTKELDIVCKLNLWGVTMGFSHYYYLDGTDFFNFGNVNTITGTAQTEVNLGYDFSTLLPNVDLSLMCYTRVSGPDVTINDKRAYSTYIETNYTHYFKYDISLTGTIGFSPWKSFYTDYGMGDESRDFAVNNLSLRFDKVWSLAKDMLELDLFLQGTMNPCNLNKDNAFIKASGDDKLDQQKLMGVIGLNIAFCGKKK